MTDTQKQQLCYSTNDEDFNHGDVDEVLDALNSEGELVAGRIYYEADCGTPKTEDVMDVDSILEAADEQMYEQIGEVYDNTFSGVSPEAKTELQALLNAWAEKHVNLGGYWIIKGKSRQCVVTEEDVKEYTQ